MQEALRLPPLDVTAYICIRMAGIAKLGLGAGDAAIDRFRRVIEANRNVPNAYFYLAAALAHTSPLDAARAAAKAGLLLNPTFTISNYRLGPPSDNRTDSALRERIITGMRKAGVPEG